MRPVARFCILAMAPLLAACAKDPVRQAYDQADNAQLTHPEQLAVGEHILPCAWAHHTAPGAADTDSSPLPLVTYFLVTTDAAGKVQKAVPAPRELQAQSAYNGLDNAVYTAYSQYQTSVLLDPKCSVWPLPPGLLGREHTFLIAVTPPGSA